MQAASEVRHHQIRVLGEHSSVFKLHSDTHLSAYKFCPYLHFLVRLSLHCLYTPIACSMVPLVPFKVYWSS